MLCVPVSIFARRRRGHIVLAPLAMPLNAAMPVREDAAHASHRRGLKLPNDMLPHTTNRIRFDATSGNHPCADIHDVASHLPLPHWKMPTSSIETSTLHLERQQKRGVPSRLVRRRQLWRRESAEGRAKKRKRVRSMHGAPFINRRMKNTTKSALGPTGARQSHCILCVYHPLTFSITECAPLCVGTLPQYTSHFGSSDTRCHSHSHT